MELRVCLAATTEAPELLMSCVPGPHFTVNGVG